MISKTVNHIQECLQIIIHVLFTNRTNHSLLPLVVWWISWMKFYFCNNYFKILKNNLFTSRSPRSSSLKLFIFTIKSYDNLFEMRHMFIFFLYIVFALRISFPFIYRHVKTTCIVKATTWCIFCYIYIFNCLCMC